MATEILLNSQVETVHPTFYTKLKDVTSVPYMKYRQT